MKNIFYISIMIFLLLGCVSTNINRKSEDVFLDDYRQYETGISTISDLCGISENFRKLLLFESDVQLDTNIYDIPVTLEFYRKWNTKKKKWINKPFLKNISINLTVSDLCRISEKFYTYLLFKSDIQLDTNVYDIPVTLEYCRNWNNEPFLINISILKHSLGTGKAGSDEYILFKTEKITIPFYSDVDKKSFAKIIETEYATREQQKARIEENRRLNPNNYDYQNLPILSMATMGVEYAPNPILIIGEVYIADQLRLFYIINRMNNGNYNIGQEKGTYGMYQFILKNSSGEVLDGIGGHMFADTAYLKYLGTTKVIMSNGYERWLPYFEMIKKNPHISNIRKIVRECEDW